MGSSFVGCIAVGELVKSTLGPKGMDKILVGFGRNDGQVEVTNDGATILRAIGVDNPAAKVLVDLAKVQDQEVGDGTTSVTVLTCELIKEAEKLIEMKIHPQTVIAGWRKAVAVAKDALTNSAIDNSGDEAKFHEDLMNISRTTLSSKILSQHKEFFAKMCVDAVVRLKGSGNLQAIQIIKKQGGTLTDSFLDNGFLLDKKIGLNQPKRVENARILIANTPMDTDKIKVFGSRIRVDSVAKVAELELAEKEKMKEKVDLILKHNCTVFINRQLILTVLSDWVWSLAARLCLLLDIPNLSNWVVVISSKRLCSVKTNCCAFLVSHWERLALWSCEAPLSKFSMKLNVPFTTPFVLSSTVKETRTVYGGGCSEVLMANAVCNLADKTPGKESLAMESFAKALRSLPVVIADNAGYDSAQLISELRAAHSQGKHTMGLNMDVGKIDCMQQMGVTESFMVKRQVLVSAAEAAEMILRVDDIIKAAPRRREQDRSHC